LQIAAAEQGALQAQVNKQGLLQVGVGFALSLLWIG